MGYTGDVLSACGLVEMDMTSVSIVAVSGDGPNVCGHLLLHTGSSGGGYYFHVADPRGYPRYMTESGYQRYLREAGKTEIRRRSVTLPDPAGARAYLERLMASTWTWLVLPNNCVAFVEEVVQAGGATWGSYTNCPVIATQDSVSEQAQQYFIQLESEIYRLYGVPR